MSQRARNKAEKWDRIRDAAQRLFAERGFEGTTIRAIAEAAGVGTGTVLVYGDTKEALLHELWRAAAWPIVEGAVGTAPEGPLRARCLHLFAPLYAHYGSQPALARVIVKELPWLTGSAAEAHQPALRALLGAISAGIVAAQARGELRADLEPVGTAGLIFSLYYAVLLQMLAPGHGLGAAAATAQLGAALDVVMTGLSTRRP